MSEDPSHIDDQMFSDYERELRQCFELIQLRVEKMKSGSGGPGGQGGYNKNFSGQAGSYPQLLTKTEHQEVEKAIQTVHIDLQAMKMRLRSSSNSSVLREVWSARLEYFQELRNSLKAEYTELKKLGERRTLLLGSVTESGVNVGGGVTNNVEGVAVGGEINAHPALQQQSQVLLEGRRLLQQANQEMSSSTVTGNEILVNLDGQTQTIRNTTNNMGIIRGELGSARSSIYSMLVRNQANQYCIKIIGGILFGMTMLLMLTSFGILDLITNSADGSSSSRIRMVILGVLSVLILSLFGYRYYRNSNRNFQGREGLLPNNPFDYNQNLMRTTEAEIPGNSNTGNLNPQLNSIRQSLGRMSHNIRDGVRGIMGQNVRLNQNPMVT